METRLCRKCSLSKLVDDFPWKVKAKGKRSPYCSECSRKMWKLRYDENRPKRIRQVGDSRVVRRGLARAFRAEYLRTHPCVDCGESDPVVLDFDHLRDKEFNISEAVKLGVSVERLKVEIEKCAVRCANCHRRITYRRRVQLRETPSSES